MLEQKTVLAATVDVNLGVQIADAAKALGARCALVQRPSDLAARALTAAPDLVVLDLQLPGLDPALAVQQLGRASGARVPVVAFGRHTEAPALRAARQGGCTEVLVRSDFFPKIGEVLGKYLNAQG